MKKSKRLRVQILFAVLFITIGFLRKLEAQEKWIPNGDISIPLVIQVHNYGPTINTTRYDSLLLRFHLSPAFLDVYSRIGDSIIMSWKVNNSTYGLLQQTMHFQFDTSEKRLRNFYIELTSDTSYTIQNQNTTISTHQKSFVSFSNISYLNSGDTLFVISKAGSLCRNILDTADYFYQNDAYYNAGIQYNSGEDDHTVYLSLDTSAYKCSIRFILTQSISKIFQQLITEQIFFISYSLPDHTIHFSFPSSDHSLTLLIYDILGREVKRIEIPSGVSEYRLQRDGFMSGYYFARLGSLGAKFVVW